MSKKIPLSLLAIVLLVTVLGVSTEQYQPHPSQYGKFIVAAYDATPQEKATANFVATGTEDGVTINEAIAAAADIGSAGIIGSVELTRGNFNIGPTTPILLRSFLHLYGEGDSTIINSKRGAWPNAAIESYTQNGTDRNSELSCVEVDHLLITGNAEPNRSAMRITGLDESRIHDVRFYALCGYGLLLDSNGENTLNESSVYDNFFDGIYYPFAVLGIGEAVSTFSGNRIWGSGFLSQPAIFIDGGQQLVLSASSFRSRGTILIEGNDLTAIAGDGIVAKNIDNVKIQNNTLAQIGRHDPNTYDVIRLEGTVRGAFITGNQLIAGSIWSTLDAANTPRCAINIAASTVADTVVQDNYIRADGLRGGSWGTAPIMDSGTGSVVVDNQTLPSGGMPSASIGLTPGWKLLGLSEDSPVPLADVMVSYGEATVSLVESHENGWVLKFFYCYDSEQGGYDMMTAPDGQLDPWCGYWVRALVECDLIIPTTPAP
ncbi:right-handed parallel beta-helix repeat-containing protein [Chloroflexota bacterium]